MIFQITRPSTTNFALTKSNKNELDTTMNVKMDYIKMDMVILNDCLKSNMEALTNVKIEGLKEDFTKLL